MNRSNSFPAIEEYGPAANAPVILETTPETQLTFSQRWNSLLVIVMAGVMAFIGITLRNNALTATETFEDLEAGVRAEIPVGWLLDSNTDDYVFRAIDPDALPYKTLLQVSILPIGPDATPNSVLDLLALQRASRFANYVELARRDEILGDDEAKRLTYAYTDFERNPFQQSLPIVVEGVDVVILRRAQAIVITYREEQSTFVDNLYRFEQLLQTVEIF